MVIPHGVGKFYGSGLPRPRIYTDVKFSHERVDPPVSVVDPLLSWAHEAHWSMGGLSTKRLRLQGRIEGNISKLRADYEKLDRKHKQTEPVREGKLHQNDGDDEPSLSASPPPAPAPTSKKRRFMILEEEDEAAEVRVKKPARKLINEFNSVATKRSPRSGKAKSVGGSFVSKMLNASENLKMMRKGGEKPAQAIESESSGEDRSEAMAEKPSRVRASPRLTKRKL